MNSTFALNKYWPRAKDLLHIINPHCFDFGQPADMWFSVHPGLHKLVGRFFLIENWAKVVQLVGENIAWSMLANEESTLRFAKDSEGEIGGNTSLAFIRSRSAQQVIFCTPIFSRTSIYLSSVVIAILLVYFIVVSIHEQAKI